MGILPGFRACKRWEMVKIIVTSLIETAKEEGHFFQVTGYTTSSFDIWPGPSNEYDAAMEFFMNPPEDGPQPFAPSGGTQCGQGMSYAYDKMQSFIVAGKWKVKNCYTFVIADEDLHVGSREEGRSQVRVGWIDEKFREYGPVYYCFTVPITPEGEIAPAGEGFVRAINDMKRELKAYYGGQYETEDCATSFGLFWNPQTNTTIGAGKLIEICQGRGKNRCTGKSSK